MYNGALPPSIVSDIMTSTLRITDVLSVNNDSMPVFGGTPLSISSGRLIGLTPIVYNTFPVGVTPTSIALSSDGTKAFVANNNNYVIPNSDSVSVLDLVNGIPLTTITDASFNQPYTITINGTIGYVTNSAASTITRINTVSNTVIGTIGGFDGPSGMVINGTTGYVNNYGASPGAGSGSATTMCFVNLVSNTVTGSMGVGLAPAALTINPSKTKIYNALYTTGNTGEGVVAVINIPSNTISATIGGFSGPFDIITNSTGTKVYVSNFGSNGFSPYGTTVSVIDTINNTISNTINVGIQPAGLILSNDNRYLYVSNYNTLYTQSFNAPVNSPGTGTVTMSSLVPGAGTVSIIDTETEEVISPCISVGQSPSNIAISSDGHTIYVSNYTSNTVSAIRIL